jgi:hypothetical protein
MSWVQSPSVAPFTSSPNVHKSPEEAGFDHHLLLWGPIPRVMRLFSVGDKPGEAAQDEKQDVKKVLNQQ